MNLAHEEEKKNSESMDGVQFTPTVAEPLPLAEAEPLTKGQESDGEMYYLPSTQSTPNIIGNASEIQEEQDQQEESVG